MTIVQGDIQNTQTINLLIEALKGKANTLLSDVSPRVSGLWSIDHAKQIYLSKISLDTATQILVRGGNAVLKVFEGEFLKEFKKDAENYFADVHLTKPMASRHPAVSHTWYVWDSSPPDRAGNGRVVLCLYMDFDSC